MLRIMKSTVIAVVGLLSALVLVGQTTSPDEKQRHPPAASGISTAAVRTGAQAPALAATDEKVNELTHRIQVLELELLKKSQQSKDQGPLIAAGAAVFVALLALVGQFVLGLREDRRSVGAAKRAADLAKEEAIYRHTEKILEFRLKQMEQFYAPMFALLRQSEGLYNKMRHEMVQDEPQKYRWTPETDPKEGRMQVLDQDGTWKGFRLLDQFPLVRKNPKALALADTVLEIGKEMTAIISTHAGLASGELLDVLGDYTAHYAVLSAIRKESRTEPYPPGSHVTGYYPRELNPKLIAGYREIAQFIDEYSQAGKRLVQNDAATKDSQQVQ